MKTWIKIGTLATLTAWGTVPCAARETRPAADEAQRAAGPAAPADNMTPYRTLAADALTAFKAHDMATAKKKGKDLESAWDKGEKALQKQSPDVWDQIDKAMDDFIKPLQTKAPDAAKIQTAYDAFIAKLKLAVKGPAAIPG